jgi:hypothetical protein
MPRYYFDIQEGSTFVLDEHGDDFDSHEAAGKSAMHAAAELARERIVKGDDRGLTVEVRNEDRQRVLSVRLVIKVNWVKPSLEPTCVNASVAT